MLFANPEISDVHDVTVIQKYLSSLPDFIETFALSLLDDGSIAMTNPSNYTCALIAPASYSPSTNPHTIHPLAKRPDFDAVFIKKIKSISIEEG
jgi:hypothetical protein